MRQEVTVSEKVVFFLNRNLGRSICDDCLRKECLLESAEEAAQIAGTLEMFPEFARLKGECEECGRTNRFTTRAV